MTLELFFGPCRLTLHATEQTLCQSILRDFSDFAVQRGPVRESIAVTSELRQPEWNSIRGRYVFSHFNGRVYGWGDRRWVRYAESLIAYDAFANQGSVISLDSERLYHYTYYLIIALTGKHLDEWGFHRFHSLGVSVAGQAALFAMPISGGKTTLGLALMQHPDVTLFSEDTPLLDRRGSVHPFAVRLSLREGHRAQIPERWTRVKNDPIFGKKILVDLDYYGLDRVQHTPGVRPLVFWSIKAGHQKPSVQPLHPLRSLAALLYFIVIGKDCPQRAEVVLRFSPAGIRMLAKLFCLRLLAACSLWRNSRSYRFFMTPDIALNAAFVKEFIREHAR